MVYRAFLFLLVTALFPVSAKAQILDPTDISDLVIWLDASDVNGTGVQPTDGASITTWSDKSGQLNDLTTSAGTVTFEETGFDGVNPGIRLASDALMVGPNVFAADYQNEMTVFFVKANVTLAKSAPFSLNGDNRAKKISDGRFSFHTPWVQDNDVYFDAGGCCDATRLRAEFPNAITETTLYTGLNNEPGNEQLLRVDAVELDSDATGHNANVSRGIRLGDNTSSGTYFDGRFAEVVVYERALTTSEIQDVECYLLNKWKQSASPAYCFPELTATKSAAVWPSGDPDIYSTPGTDVIYTINVSHDSGPALDDGSMFIVDEIPDELTFYNGDIDDPSGPLSDPVEFVDASSGLSWTYGTSVGFSSGAAKPADMDDCTYDPAAGYDPLVTFICINPSGRFGSVTAGSSFSVSFRMQIN